MRGEASLRTLVSQRTRERGDSYFAQGRVRQLVRTGSTIDAEVEGSSLYLVTLTLHQDEVIAQCTCPVVARDLEPCKHIWAVIRAAGARNWLPDRDLVLTVEDDREDFEEEAVVTPLPVRDARPQWQRFLESLRPAIPPRAASPAPTVPDEVAYVLPRYPRGEPGLALEILGRARKKSGEWGKWKPVGLRLDELHHLPQFDAESIALLHQRSYGPLPDRMIHLAQSSAAWWIERLAQNGRLFVRERDDVLRPIAWDDGPPWTLDVAVVDDTAARKYQIVAALKRDGETMPLANVDGIASGLLFARGRAHRFADTGRAQWLQALSVSGPVEIPHADADRFRAALLRAPVGNIELPEALGWNIADIEPVPVLALMHDNWSTELHGDLLFEYGEWRVASRSTEMQTTIGRKLIRRDTAREMRLRTRLGSSGVIAAWNEYRVRLPQLESIARTLTAEGWKIEIDSMAVRVADDIDVEISSGIDWFDLQVSAVFGDSRVVLPELLSAAEAKRSLLRLDDGSYGIVPGNWDDALTAVVEMGKSDGKSVRFRSTQALLVDALLKSSGKDVRSFADLRQRIAGAEPAPRQEPPTLAATLRPYQRAGLGWLHFLRDTGFGGCLADDMGLGKTVQTIALLEELRANGSERPSLVVAPRSLLFNWAAEAKRFAPQLRVIEHHGTARSGNVFTDCDVVLTTYATMRLDVERLAGTEFEYVILDESQAIKNASSQVAKATRLLKARHRLALSGTPIENHLGELWSLFEFLNPGLLGPARTFSRTFAGRNAPQERRDALARALRPLILRRTKEQVAPELPERIEQTLYCELEGKQRKQYEELRDHYRRSLLGRDIDKSRMHILEALLRLRQAACDPALIDPESDAPSAKVELLMDELRDVIDSGHRALVFSQFTSFLDIVRKKLDVEHLYLDGKTRDRQSLVDQFQSASGPPLFLISLKAGGLGLNLTNADYIFLLDPWWNPAVEAQAIDRAHRIGRQKPVVAYRIIARDTVEEKIIELQARKRELADSILSEDNSVLRKLDVEDLEMLLG